MRTTDRELCCLQKKTDRLLSRFNDFTTFDIADIPTEDNSYTQATLITGFDAGANLDQWDVVYMNSSGDWVLADANGSGTYPARGIVVEAAANGSPAKVLIRGYVRNDTWTPTIGGNYYLSNTAGEIDQTAPSTAGDKVQVVGFAVATTTVLFDFNGTYLTVPTP